MEKMAQSSFNIETIFRYIGGRFQVRRFVPLAFILYLGYLLCFNFSPASPQNFIVILLLLLSFRLMDDLFDLQFDRHNFPDRVLSRVKDTKLFVIFLFALYLLLGAIFVLDGHSLSVFLMLGAVIFLGLWYAKFRYFFNSRLIHTLIILLKYPFILYIIGPGLTRTEIPVLVYLTFLLFEIKDDPGLKSNITARWVHTFCSFGYLALLFIFLALPSKSIDSWVILILFIGLQAISIALKNDRIAYIPFINTLLLFVFLSVRHFLQ